MSIRQGEIYWVNDCPPLHGNIAAPHAIILLNPKQRLDDPAQPVLGMAVSSSIPTPGPLHIPMPNKLTHNPCTTCFTKPCWAVSSWILRINDRKKLGARCGYVGGATLAQVLTKFDAAIEQGLLPIDHPPSPPPPKAGQVGRPS